MLSLQVALIFGVCGALRSCELLEVTVNHVRRVSRMWEVLIPRTNTYVSKFFMDENFMPFVNMYMEKRVPLKYTFKMKYKNKLQNTLTWNNLIKYIFNEWKSPIKFAIMKF